MTIDEAIAELFRREINADARPSLTAASGYGLPT
jgi:hypothetical protein